MARKDTQKSLQQTNQRRKQAALPPYCASAAPHTTNNSHALLRRLEAQAEHGRVLKSNDGSTGFSAKKKQLKKYFSRGKSTVRASESQPTQLLAAETTLLLPVSPAICFQMMWPPLQLCPPDTKKAGP
ncbi:hypothetical protein H8B14_01770 [Hymenobacter sp. BT190]|nr:hypothetical protein [Hymenobacter sp. BT190]